MISKSNVKFTDSNVKLIAAIMRFSLFSSKQCIIKQLLDSVFVISGIIKVSVSVISISLRFRLITLSSTLINPDITKTSSNNCLIYVGFYKSCKKALRTSQSVDAFLDKFIVIIVDSQNRLICIV